MRKALQDLVNVIDQIGNNYPVEKCQAWIADFRTFIITRPAYDQAVQALASSEAQQDAEPCIVPQPQRETADQHNSPPTNSK